jgi:ribonucleoside-diphosphate reductase alpha chain
MFSLAFIRQVMKDTKGRPTIMREVNYVFENLAKERGFYSDEMIDEIIEEGSLAAPSGDPGGDQEGLRHRARHHAVLAHAMQGAFQRHCDSSISKTINFPHDATAEDVRKIYDLAIELDVKGVTVYRDGCRDVQPMALKGSKRDAHGAKPRPSDAKAERRSSRPTVAAPVIWPTCTRSAAGDHAVACASAR